MFSLLRALLTPRAYNTELRALVDEATSTKEYPSVAERANFNRYELRDSITIKEVVEDNRILVEITFKKELAQLLNFDQLSSDIQRNRDDLRGRNGYCGSLTTTTSKNGETVMKYDGEAYGGDSLIFMQCAIPFYLVNQHKRMMEQDPRAFPLFHIRMEMNEIYANIKQNAFTEQFQVKNKFADYKKTMKDLIDVMDVLSGKKENHVVNLEMSQYGAVYFEKVPVAQDTPDNTREIFNKLLLQLDRQSKQMLSAKKFGIIGELMAAFGAVMMAAGVALGVVAGPLLIKAGSPAAKERQQYKKVGQLMNNFYSLYKDEVDRPAQPSKESDSLVRKNRPC